MWGGGGWGDWDKRQRGQSVNARVETHSDENWDETAQTERNGFTIWKDTERTVEGHLEEKATFVV